MTRDEYIAECRRRFGDDRMAWAFVCPACGHRQTIRDYHNANAPSGAIAFSCVGRWIKGGVKVREAFAVGEDADAPGPCNYAGGGLFKLNPVEVVDTTTGENTETRMYFDFAPTAEAAPDLGPAGMYAGEAPHQDTDTSIEAARKALGSAQSKRRKVFNFIRDRAGHGATDNEIEIGLVMLRQSVCARRNELVKVQAVLDSGNRRATETGSGSIVWIAAARYMEVET